MAEVDMKRRALFEQGNSVAQSNARTRLNAALSWIIVVLLVVSPLPLGSTPPVTWTIWGAVVGLTSCVYLLLLRRTGRQARFDLSSIGIASLLHLVLCGYLVVQLLPIGGLFGGFPLTLSDGTLVHTATISVAPGDTMLTLVRMLTYGLLFYLTMQVSVSDKNRHFLMRAIVVIVTLQALYALLALFQLDDTFLGAAKWKYLGSATGTFLNRNNFATYLIFGLCCSTVLAASTLLPARDGGTKLRLDPIAALYVISSIAIVITITVTNSRMGFALAWLALALIIALLIARNTKLLRYTLVLVPVALACLLGLFFTYGQELWVRFEGSGINSLARLQLYNQIIPLIAERPWFGFGGGTFEQAFPIVHGADLRPDLDWDKAHNTYLTLWSELGIVFGSIPIVLVAGLAVFISARLARAAGSWTAQVLCLVVILVAGIHSLVDFSLEIEAVTFLFIVICAIGLAGSKLLASSQ